MTLLTPHPCRIPLGSRFHWAFLVLAFFLLPLSLRASDHADPIHLPQGFEIFDDGKPNAAATARAAGNTTDLFVFPVGADGKLINFPDKEGPPFTPFEQNKPPVYLETTDVAQIKALAVVFCVRPGLRKAPPLDLSQYTYFIHMDLHSRVVFDPASSEFARHGGSIPEPEKISPDVTIEIQLNNDTTVKKQTITSPSNIIYNAKTLNLEEIAKSPNDIQLYTGYQGNPFLFPKFFGTNIVSMVLMIPVSCFPDGQRDWLFWGATVGKNGKQFDHVGRSLRTQNPRFDLLNTYPPKDHVKVLKDEEKNPSLMRNLFVKFGFDSFFAYRPWDYTPAVMIYTNRFNVGYPNGRRLEDDVAALLARYGDTLLYELSYTSAKFPRDTKIPGERFHTEFPYLVAPLPDSPVPAGPFLSTRNKVIVGAIVVSLLVLVLFAAGGFWAVIKSLFRKRPIPG